MRDRVRVTTSQIRVRLVTQSGNRRLLSTAAFLSTCERDAVFHQQAHYSVKMGGLAGVL